MEEGAGAVGIDVHLDPRLDEMGAHRAWRDLQFQPAIRNAIVVHHLAFLLHAKDLAEIDAGDRGEGRTGLSLRHGEARVVGGQIDLADEGVGWLDRRDLRQRKLLDQPVLQGQERPL